MGSRGDRIEPDRSDDTAAPTAVIEAEAICTTSSDPAHTAEMSFESAGIRVVLSHAREPEARALVFPEALAELVPILSSRQRTEVHVTARFARVEQERGAGPDGSGFGPGGGTLLA